MNELLRTVRDLAVGPFRVSYVRTAAARLTLRRTVLVGRRFRLVGRRRISIADGARLLRAVEHGDRPAARAFFETQFRPFKAANNRDLSVGPSRIVVIQHCIMNPGHGGVTLGSEMAAGIEHSTMSAGITLMRRWR